MPKYFLCFSLLILLVFTNPIAKGESIVRKKALDPSAFLQRNLLINPQLEEGATKIENWQGWELGYEIDEAVSHSGKRSAKCQSSDPRKEYGIFQVVNLNQEKPIPILAQCFSKAENVSGTPDSGYSLYLDIEYVDGDHLWGRTSSFSCGTHDWERKSVWIFPEKPIKQVTIYGLFRWHTGTVWFDDFSLAQLEGVQLFEGTPIQSIPLQAPTPKQTLTLKTPDGFSLILDKETGYVIGDNGRRGGFYLRDVASGSDFRQPLGEVKQFDGKLIWEGVDEELQLKLSVSYSVERINSGYYKGQGYIRVDGIVEDLAKRDRAISVYFSLPIDAVGWLWSNDMRSEERIEEGRNYIKAIQVPAGATGSMSWYHLACISGDKEGISLAIPLDEPRLYRISYDSQEKEFFIVYDFALVPDTVKFPSKADFHFIIYPIDPKWKMRSALEKYYEIFPQFFLKRVKKEGIWMPFADISTVEGFEDFHFAFQEGAPNPAFDEQHGIYSFIYVEPASHWLSMPQDAPRTYEGAMEVLQRDLKGERGEGNRDMAIATLTSGIYGPDGKFFCAITKAPWCDGAVFLLNPDPDVPTTPELPLNKAMVMLRGIESALSREFILTEGWGNYGQGYRIDDKIRHSGRYSIRCEAKDSAKELGASQTVVLNQKEPKQLIVSAWSKAEGVTGEPNLDYAIYVDLYYVDGTPEWAINVPFSVGTHDWERKELVINPKKPIATLTVHLLFRRTHKGTVWFDDVSLTEFGSEKNLLKNPGFEEKVIKGKIDGTYLDSYEMGAMELNFRREHFPSADIPLVFQRESYQPCQLFIFHTYEFEREIAKRMHSQNNLLFANAVLWNFPFPAHLLDVLGTEVNWLATGEYRPDDDAIMNYRRALCYRKPYCLLMNTNYEKFNHQLVEKYFKRCLFYAIFPGFFDEEAASKDPYWTSPKKWYERDRDLFKKYLPLIISLAKAGWEPITYAFSDNKKVYVERYGRVSEGNLHFTVFNDSDKKESFRLTIDLASLGVKGNIKVKELISGKDVPFTLRDGELEIEGDLEPEDVWLLKIDVLGG
jgi:hypothetical protein